jgi:Ca2+/H+ antiporter
LTGISEILVLVLLITCILILPRLFKGDHEKKAPSISLKKLPLKLRVAIILTLLYPVGMALYLKPWDQNPILYLSWGIMPVVFVWAIIWILAGRKK